MPQIAIHTRTDRRILFAGDYPSLRRCAEDAVQRGASLMDADLRDADLSNATLDGADLRRACLDGCDCTGANLSECDITGACARGCDFTLACMAEARLVAVDFTDTTFTATLLAAATIDACTFSCPTALLLPFTDCAVLGTNTYRHDNTTPLQFSAPPVVVTGLAHRLAFLDDAALTGNLLRPDPRQARALLADFLNARSA